MILNATRRKPVESVLSPAMHHALIVSAQPKWAAESGVSDMLTGLGLSVHEVHHLDVTAVSQYAIVVLHSATYRGAPHNRSEEPIAMPGAIVLVSGIAPAERPAASVQLPEPITEASLSAVLAAAGYALPLPTDEAILQHVGDLVGCDADIMAELVASLLATNRADQQTLADACAAGHWPDVRASAHRIKGTAHLVDAAALAALSLRIETLARQDDSETVRALMLLYMPAVAMLSQALARLAA